MPSQSTQPSFVFRLYEIYDTNPTADANGHWTPAYSNALLTGGASGIWWLCDGVKIRPLAETQLPAGLGHFKTFSMFYIDGRGFVVLRGSAIHPGCGEIWLPLCFEHDTEDGYSSYLTNTKEKPALLCRRNDQTWVKMLLPDVYHGHWEVPGQEHGALKGELPIFLALIAFSIPKAQVQERLPLMFQNGSWQQYNMAHGRVHGRGVMVEVYTLPGGSSAKDLRRFEAGKDGLKYYH